MKTATFQVCGRCWGFLLCCFPLKPCFEKFSLLFSPILRSTRRNIAQMKRRLWSYRSFFISYTCTDKQWLKEYLPCTYRELVEQKQITWHYLTVENGRMLLTASFGDWGWGERQSKTQNVNINFIFRLPLQFWNNNILAGLLLPVKLAKLPQFLNVWWHIRGILLLL